jgi:hypothetical protein
VDASKLQFRIYSGSLAKSYGKQYIIDFSVDGIKFTGKFRIVGTIDSKPFSRKIENLMDDTCLYVMVGLTPQITNVAVDFAAVMDLELQLICAMTTFLLLY